MPFELLNNLINNLKKLPGIGEKSARRMAMHIITINKESALQIAESIKISVESYKRCSVCNMLSETDPCPICSDENRDQNTLCIVETTQDALLIQNTHEYKGRFFVLSKLLSPLQGIGPKEISFPKLLNMIETNHFKEIILALNPSAEGETTINFIFENLKNPSYKITRLSTGLPFGGDIEYINSLTLIDALKRRYKIE